MFIEEVSGGFRPIPGVPTSVTAFIGRAKEGPLDTDPASPMAIRSFVEFQQTFGGLWLESMLGFAVRDFFLNGGTTAIIVRLEHVDGESLQESDFIGEGKEDAGHGLFALNRVDLFNLLCIPGYKDTDFGFDVDRSVIARAANYCEARRAMLLVDAPAAWRTAEQAKAGIAGVGTASRNAALFFPRLRQPNPERNNQLEEFGPTGAVAGVFARTDAISGVWKAPAGLEATLVGAPELTASLTDSQNGELNSLAVNSLRVFPRSGPVVWGARTLEGADALASEWKYIPVRRLALFLEESVSRGTKWVAFEPNDEPLWAQVRLNVSAFMQQLFRKGAFQGTTPKDAYFVKCDAETNRQEDIDGGGINIVIGFAPLKPAEFVVIKIQQMAAPPQLQVLREIAKDSRGKTIIALFAGASGTGKSMAARALANHLERPFYRVDLSSVISKFIGETEKNLRRLFDAAEQGGSILFFDEADTLFDQRSEVKDSHDRYANAELSYLLQRLEEYRGLSILAIGRKERFDPALLCRFNLIVDFPSR